MCSSRILQTSKVITKKQDGVNELDELMNRMTIISAENVAAGENLNSSIDGKLSGSVNNIADMSILAEMAALEKR